MPTARELVDRYMRTLEEIGWKPGREAHHKMTDLDKAIRRLAIGSLGNTIAIILLAGALIYHILN